MATPSGKVTNAALSRAISKCKSIARSSFVRSRCATIPPSTSARVLQGDIEALGQILAPAEQLEFPRSNNRSKRLLPDLAEDQGSSLMPAFPRHPLQRVDAGGIDGGHVAQAQDEHLRRLRDLGNDIFEFRRRAEKERPVDRVHFDAGRDLVSANKFFSLAHLRDFSRVLPSVAQVVGAFRK